MDLGIVLSLVMLIVWAVLTFIVNDAPGITHALLTGGLALLIWRVVKRSEQGEPRSPRQP